MSEFDKWIIRNGLIITHNRAVQAAIQAVAPHLHYMPFGNRQALQASLHAMFKVEEPNPEDKSSSPPTHGACT